MRLKNSVVLITGASSGIGEAAALAFARKGARLALCGRRLERLQAVAQRCRAAGSPRVTTKKVDVAKRVEARAFVASALRDFDRVDVLVNNAGLGWSGPLARMPEEKARELVDVNILGLLWTAQAAVDAMVGQHSGVVINVSSIAGVRATPYSALYSATKHAVTGLSHALRGELSGTGVKVCAVYPAVTRTEFFTVSGGQEVGPVYSAEWVANLIVRTARFPRRDAMVFPFRIAHLAEPFLGGVIDHAVGEVRRKADPGQRRLTPMVVLLALGAAGLHAGWNVLLKTSGDPLPTSTRSVAASALVVTPAALVAWWLTGHPWLPAAGWAVLALSSVAELFYFIFLSRAYRAGDLSVVYPLARGTGPLVAVAAGLLLLRERLSLLELAGVAALLAGIWLVRKPRMHGAVVPALITGAFIGTYTTLDRVGINLGSPWLYAGLLWGLMAVLLGAWTRGVPLRRGHGENWRTSLTIGLLMATAYGLALVALTLAPVAIVAPLRESAIVLVTAWGVWRLKEREGAALRLVGAVAIVAGIVLIAL